MAKGFGVQPEKQLGYVLLLMPQAKAYAVRFDFDDFSGSGGAEEFIGVTNMLEEAQVWKKIDQAKKAVKRYAEFLLEQAENGSQVRVDIKKLKRSSDGKLTDELVESLFLVPGDYEDN